MEKVKGTYECRKCYRFVQLAGEPLCIGKVGKDSGLKKIEGWAEVPCENFLDFPWKDTTAK